MICFIKIQSKNVKMTWNFTVFIFCIIYLFIYCILLYIIYLFIYLFIFCTIASILKNLG